MKPIEKIIELIEKGDPVPILAEDSLTDCFNTLLKHNFIDIVNEKVILTQKGKEARTVGFEKVIFELNLQEELKEFSPDTQKQESKVTSFCFGLCLILMVVFLAIALTDCSVLF